jgi:hypothetical protein
MKWSHVLRCLVVVCFAQEHHHLSEAVPVTSLFEFDVQEWVATFVETGFLGKFLGALIGVVVGQCLVLAWRVCSKIVDVALECWPFSHDLEGVADSHNVLHKKSISRAWIKSLGRRLHKSPPEVPTDKSGSILQGCVQFFRSCMLCFCGHLMPFIPDECAMLYHILAVGVLLPTQGVRRHATVLWRLVFTPWSCYMLAWMIDWVAELSTLPCPTAVSIVLWWGRPTAVICVGVACVWLCWFSTITVALVMVRCASNGGFLVLANLGRAVVWLQSLFVLCGVAALRAMRIAPWLGCYAILLVVDDSGTLQWPTSLPSDGHVLVLMCASVTVFAAVCTTARLLACTAIAVVKAVWLVGLLVLLALVRVIVWLHAGVVVCGAAALRAVRIAPWLSCYAFLLVVDDSGTVQWPTSLPTDGHLLVLMCTCVAVFAAVWTTVRFLACTAIVVVKAVCLVGLFVLLALVRVVVWLHAGVVVGGAAAVRAIRMAPWLICYVFVLRVDESGAESADVRFAALVVGLAAVWATVWCCRGGAVLSEHSSTPLPPRVAPPLAPPVSRHNRWVRWAALVIGFAAAWVTLGCCGVTSEHSTIILPPLVAPPPPPVPYLDRLVRPATLTFGEGFSNANVVPEMRHCELQLAMPISHFLLWQGLEGAQLFCDNVGYSRRQFVLSQGSFLDHGLHKEDLISLRVDTPPMGLGGLGNGNEECKDQADQASGEECKDQTVQVKNTTFNKSCRFCHEVFTNRRHAKNMFPQRACSMGSHVAEWLGFLLGQSVRKDDGESGHLCAMCLKVVEHVAKHIPTHRSFPHGLTHTRRARHARTQHTHEHIRYAW